MFEAHRYLRARQALERLAGIMAVVDWTDTDHMAFDGPLLESVVKAGLEDCRCFKCWAYGEGANDA